MNVVKVKVLQRKTNTKKFSFDKKNSAYIFLPSANWQNTFLGRAKQYFPRTGKTTEYNFLPGDNTDIGELG